MKAKQILSGYTGKSDICDIFMKKENLSKTEMDSLWDQYLEFMVIKALGCDSGSHTEMKYSTSVLMDEYGIVMCCVL